MNFHKQTLQETLAERILVLDGAMGTLLREQWPEQGSCDLLNLVRPDAVLDIHRQYVEAGVDILTTNTTEANAVSQRLHGSAAQAYAMNVEGARLARRAADASGRQVWVAGSMGPTRLMLSKGGDYDALKSAYAEQARALKEGGADLLLAETCTDVRNAEALAEAVAEVGDIPLVVSATISNRTGMLPDGHTPEELYAAVAHYHPAAFGLNCSNGPLGLEPVLKRLSDTIDIPLCVYPSAGLPDAAGRYPVGPDELAQYLCDWVRKGYVRMVGGCCGTTPAYIRCLCSRLP